MTASRQPAQPPVEPPGEISLSQLHRLEADEAVLSDRIYLASRLLWEERSFILRVMKWGAALFLVIAVLYPGSYQSTGQLMPPDSQSAGALASLVAGGGSGGSGGGALSAAADLLGMKSNGALFVSLLESDSVRDRIINRFDLRGVYWVKTYASARRRLASHTDISEDKKSGVISITVTEFNRERAAAIARAYIEELNRIVADVNTSAAHRERLFLEDRLQALKIEMDQAEKDLSEFSSKNNTLDIKDQGRAMVEAAATLEGQIVAAESQLRGLEQVYTPNNVRVRSLQARVGALQRQLDQLSGSRSAPEDSAQRPLPYPSIRQLPLLGVTYADLYRRVKVDETAYEILTREYELARIEEVKEVPVVKVIDPPQVPERRSGPPRTGIFLGGVLLSFCVAGVWLFGGDAWSHVDPQNPKRLLLEEIASTIRGSVSQRLDRERH